MLSPESSLSARVARLLWLVPVALVLLSANQLKVGLDLRQTYATGEALVARVTEYERVDRADITHGYVSLEVAIPDGSVLRKDRMPLPYSLLHRVEGADSLEVFVNRGAPQELIIASVANAQWKMAVIQSAIALGAALMAFVGVLAWNRYLRRGGQPRNSSGYMSPTNSA